MQPIIPPVDPTLIIGELTADRMLRRTNRGSNELYIVTAASAPHTMREIGRLREHSFRAAGGGTGLECDIDRFDTMTPPCRQLIVWDPESRQILGGYRYICGSDIRLDHTSRMPRIATAHMFSFSEQFMTQFLPYTIELGRSWVRTDYQSSRAGAKAIYVLDNLWDGLGALTVLHPRMRYFFGKMTMYPSYSRPCRDMILHFLHHHFPDPDKLVRPIKPLADIDETEQVRILLSQGDYHSQYHQMSRIIRSMGYNIPPLVNAYMNLSPTMRIFGTAINDEFGLVEETGLLIAVSDIADEKKQRHIDTYTPVSAYLNEATG